MNYINKYSFAQLLEKAEKHEDVPDSTIGKILEYYPEFTLDEIIIIIKFTTDNPYITGVMSSLAKNKNLSKEARLLLKFN